jgi:fructan beta-fructosidase
MLTACSTSSKQPESTLYAEPHRPQIHFSPKEKWMNDPNGMVFYNNQYHLFYQYYPDSTIWGPMHWGHATSTNLVHWEHRPVALFPDSLGYIFSGSAVVDVNNTAGFGKNSEAPLVAIFTHHDTAGEKAGRNDYQVQSLAYSLDNGNTWTKYDRNPVLNNPGIKDFRDPKVFWHNETNQWIMALAVLDRISFYSSPNLKDWTLESDFGKEVGAHGGVWECPDLFPLEYNDETIWVLLVSINPGGPNGGSGTQYFTGSFDGKIFTPFQTDTRWLDYGPDNYAGVTWSNTGKRKIFLGWMGNWQYAQVVPTEKWRSAMTVPRDLAIEKLGEKYLVSSHPVPEIDALSSPGMKLENINANNFDLTEKTGLLNGPARLSLQTAKAGELTISLSNESGQRVVIGYDAGAKQYFIDRRESGNIDFEKGFAGKHIAPRVSDKQHLDITLIIDVASIELFADNGLTAMTQVFFPDSPFTKITLQSPDNLTIHTLNFNHLKSIYLNRH